MVRCAQCGRVYDSRDYWVVKIIVCHKCRQLQGTSVKVVFALNQDEKGHHCVSQMDSVVGGRY